jgi:hypothetical protein
VAPLDWLPWATEAFQRAQRARRPILLLLTSGWAPACRHLEERLVSDPDAHAIVERAFVPVKVDVDWRPDIADRYGLEAWPTLLALTPEGLVLGGGIVEDIDLQAWLTRVADLFARHDGTLPRAPREQAPVSPVADETATAEAWEQLSLAIEPGRRAFGAPGQPALAPALAALAGLAVGLPAYAGEAERTIDVLLDSPRWDRTRGLLQVRGTLAWELGAPRARLDTQAEWVRLLARAVALDSRPVWQDALDRAVHGLRTAFAGPTPAWTPWTGGPAVVLVDGMARASRALLAAADVRDRGDWATEAIAALEAVVPQVYTRGAGLSHVLSTRPHGPALLTDSMLVAHALLDAAPWVAQPVYRDLAEELLLSARVRLAHPSGALCDRRHTMAGANDVGRLGEDLCPIDGNAEAARLCLRLLSGEGRVWQDGARRLLAGIHHETRQAGGFAAPAVMAWTALAWPEHPISVW